MAADVSILDYYVHLVGRCRCAPVKTTLVDCEAVDGRPCEWCKAGSPISKLTVTGSYGYPKGESPTFLKLVTELKESGH